MSKFFKPRYESDADYTTNAPSYYDELARKQKLFELLSERIWEYDEKLELKFEELDNLLDTRFEEWQTKIDNMSTEMRELFTEWLNDGTLADLVNIDVMNMKADKLNPYFENEFSEKATFGDELLINTTDELGEGWSGNNAKGYQHISGKTAPLTISLDENIAGIYQVTVEIYKTVFNDTQGRSDYFISLGGSEHFETYRGIVTNQVWGINALGLNNNLVITPDKNFTGTLKLSVKKMLTTISPYARYLDSNGNTTFEKRLTTPEIQSTYLGLKSGENSFGLASEANVGVGFQALKTNTSGFWNVGLGVNALGNNSVGTRNVGIGYIALQANISGDRNIAIGSFSLVRNTTGRSNVAIGADTLWFNESGESNIAIGLVAMGSNTDGKYNIGIGDHALNSGEHGSHNVALGRLALSANEGDNNIGLGTQPMYRHVTGNGNIALGYWSMYEHVDGIENIAIGYRAMDKSTEGNSNIAIGRESLANSTANSNIAIGNGALKYHETDPSNIALGNAAMAFHTTGRGNIGIGATSGAAIVTGQDNVFLGFNTGYNLKNGDKNILIGYNLPTPQPDYSNYLNIGNVIRSNDTTTGEVLISKLTLTGLPYNDPKVVGALWDDNGTIKRSQG